MNRKRRKPRKNPDPDGHALASGANQVEKRQAATSEADDLSVEDCLAEEQPVKRNRSPSSTAADTMNRDAKKKFLSGLHQDDCGNGKHRGTLVPKWTLRIVSNSNDALVFAQIGYWIIRHGNPPNPRRQLNYRWVAKSATDLAQELHRTRDEVDHSFQRLRRQKLIDWKARKFGGVKQRHVWILWSNVHVAYQQVTDGLSEVAHQ